MDIDKAYDKLYRYIFFKIHSREVSEDITQETFLRYIGRYGQNGSYNMKLMYTIARNLCIDEYRKDKTLPLPDDHEFTQDTQEYDFSEKLILDEALSALPEEDRELLLLRYVNGEAVSTISDLYKCSRFSTYRKLKTALAKFRESLEVKEDDG
jgi:RNA polymerase sigma-70 factor (ECF subfamily)